MTITSRTRLPVKLTWSERISVLSFLVLFPGYLIYHFSVASGLFPPILGGYYGAMSVCLLLLMVVAALGNLADHGLSAYEWLVVFFFSYCFAWVAIHFILGEGFQGSIELAIRSASYLPLLIVLFLAGRFFNATGTRRMRLFSLTLVLMTLMVIGQLDENFVVGLIRNVGESGVQTSTYQGYARSVIVIALLVLANSRGVSSAFYILITTVTLFLIGARSEFAGFLFVVIVLLPYWFRTNKWVASGLVFAGFVAFYVFITSAISLDLFRISELLDLERSSSFQARRELTMSAIQTIISSPILGDYGSDRLGYSHNALGAWVSFGILGFVIYVGLVLVAAADSLVRVLSSPRSAAPSWLMSYCFNVYSLIMIVAAKHVSDPVIAIGWGLYVAAATERHLAKTIGPENTSGKIARNI